MREEYEKMTLTAENELATEATRLHEIKHDDIIDAFSK